MILDQLCASNTTACHWYMRCHQPWRGLSKLEPFVPCHAHPSTYATLLHASQPSPSLTSLAEIAGFISTFSLVSLRVHLCRDRNELFIDICDKFARLALHKLLSLSIYLGHLQSLLNRLHIAPCCQENGRIATWTCTWSCFCNIWLYFHISVSLFYQIAALIGA